MTPKPSTSRLRVVKPPAGAQAGGHVHPTPEQREAARLYLRGADAGEQQALLDATVACFEEAHWIYVELAREAGEGSDVWDRAHWVIANTMAEVAVDRGLT